RDEQPPEEGLRVDLGAAGAMTTPVALVVVLLVLVANNAWVHLGPSRSHLLTGPLAALLLLLVGRAAGLTWEQLGLGRQTLLSGVVTGVVAAVAVAVVYAVGMAIPFTRKVFRDTRYRIGLRTALYLALVAIPVGTVLFEEVAFRGVLWGLLSRDLGVSLATLVSACIFGLWHVLPALDLARTNTSVQGQTPGSRRVAVTVLATAAFTALAGIVFAELRRRSGSLAAPIGLHWATNGLGVLAAAHVWAADTTDSAAPET
ncbi:MAG: CPBP family intramembrane glutamic endopeptidase, partial [Dermatophilaceae bacterium]